MKAKPTSIANKTLWQQLRFALQAWKKEGPSAFLYNRIVLLSRQLRQPNLKSVLARVGVLAGLMAFGSISQAQTFSAPQENPFGYQAPGSAFCSVVDFDGDNDFDILTTYYSAIGLIENVGTNVAPDFDDLQANPFSIPGNSGSLFGIFGDIDSDGDMDYFGSDEYSYATTFSENTGDIASPLFTNLQANTLGITTLATGGGRFMKFVDLDADGDDDIVATNYFYETPALTYFQNTGTAADPSFAAGIDNAFGLNNLPGVEGPFYFVDFGDIDLDGDLDAVASYGIFNYLNESFTPSIAVYTNNGTASAPAFGTPQINPFGIDFNGIEASALYDIFVRDMNNDGDQDIMLINITSGQMQYFNNEVIVGNLPPTSAGGEVTVSANPIYNFSEADFSFSDPNPDDALDLIQITALPTQGSLKLNGNAVTVNQNVIAAQIPNLTFEPDAGEFGANYTSFLFKVYSNGLYSTSEYAMVINVDENTASTDLNQSAWASVYPTLVEGNKSLVLTIKENDKVDAQLLDMSGRILETKNNLEQGQHEWSLANLPSGVYVMRVQAGTRTGVARIVKK